VHQSTERKRGLEQAKDLFILQIQVNVVDAWPGGEAGHGAHGAHQRVEEARPDRRPGVADGYGEPVWGPLLIGVLNKMLQVKNYIT